MTDFVLGVAAAGLVVRGWVRGWLRESLDLAALLVALAVAFRLAEPVGDQVIDRFLAEPEVARVVTAILLTAVMGAAAAVAVGVVVRRLGRAEPRPADRLGGAAVGLVSGVVVLTLFVATVRATPGGDGAIDRSEVVAAAVPVGGWGERALVTITGDEVLESVLALTPRFGASRIVLDGDDRVALDEVDPSELTERPEQAVDLHTLVNEVRVAADVDPLAWSEGLAGVALGHAQEMYEDGYLSHVSPRTGAVADRATAAGMRLAAVGENLALASTIAAAHDAMMSSPTHRDLLLSPGFDRVGMAVVEGPLGVVVVQVFGR